MADAITRYVNPSRVMLGECTRKEIRQALQSGNLKAAIISIHTQFIADKLQKMIDATDKGHPLPAPE